MSHPEERASLLRNYASVVAPSGSSAKASALTAHTPPAGQAPTTQGGAVVGGNPGVGRGEAGGSGPEVRLDFLPPSAAAPAVQIPRKTGLRQRARLEREEPLREHAALGFVGRLSTYCTCTTYDLRALFAALQSLQPTEGQSVRRLSRDLLLLQRLPTRLRIGHARHRPGAPPSSPLLDSDGADAPHAEHLDAEPAWAGVLTPIATGAKAPAPAADKDWLGDAGDTQVEDLVTGAAIFFFSYGTLVCWGLSESAEWAILDWLQPYENGQLSPTEMEKEFFTYTYNYEVDKARIKNDNIMLPGALVERSRLMGIRRSASAAQSLAGNNGEWANTEEADLSDEEFVLVQTSISHALAQSCKLGSFENSVDLLIERCGNVPMDLVQRGQLRLSDRDVMRMSGEVHLYRSYFNLQTDLLGTPDWFWENEEVEPIYERTARWLDTDKRGQLLNQRLEILKDLFGLFRDEVHVRTEYRLEWIIIVLIVAEVLLQLLAMALGLSSAG
ncbi:hypothetical protein CDCA_CDCA11G3120 [Cyanidium caldarium]|uniref:DUF155 domain-containing protein n=1 Tax=Cyanidium caldarium TaxID=2771 RepID=A0AAV9IXN7_CYACA|nr:hypothetical protein CDCA_CDCA11G3120 [Cyanidium caldarium]